MGFKIGSRISFMLALMLATVPALADLSNEEKLQMFTKICNSELVSKEISSAISAKANGLDLAEAVRGHANRTFDAEQRKLLSNRAPAIEGLQEHIWRYAYQTPGTDSVVSEKTRRQCLVFVSTRLEGSNSKRVAFCKREANSVKQFAKIREMDVTLAQALELLRKQAPKMAEQVSRATGITLSAEEAYRGSADLMRYAFKYPNTSPEQLETKRYRSCIASN